MSSGRVDGVYELGHALHVLDGEIHGFSRSDIELLDGEAALPIFTSPEEPLGGWSGETSHLDKVFAGSPT